MALTVEDGTGLADADAFISLAYANTFHRERHNTDWLGGDVADQEAAIRNVTLYMSESLPWEGVPTHERRQALAFPREGLYDKHDLSIKIDEIPRELEQACALLSLYELQNPGTFTTATFDRGRILTRKKIGPIEKQWSVINQTPAAARPTVIMAMDLISQFFGGPAARQSSLVGGRGVS